MATESSRSTQISYEDEKHVDFAHVDRLSSREQSFADHHANEFLDDIERHFDETYLHLDVKILREQKRGVAGMKWKVLLITNRGRYHTEQMGFGVEHSLKNAFDALKQQIKSRLEKLDRIR